MTGQISITYEVRHNGVVSSTDQFLFDCSDYPIDRAVETARNLSIPAQIPIQSAKSPWLKDQDGVQEIQYSLNVEL
jgi:hypothetical protein